MVFFGKSFLFLFKFLSFIAVIPWHDNVLRFEFVLGQSKTNPGGERQRGCDDSIKKERQPLRFVAKAAARLLAEIFNFGSSEVYDNGNLLLPFQHKSGGVNRNVAVNVK